MVSMRSANERLAHRRNVVDEALEAFVQDRMTGSEAPAMSLARDVLLAGGKRYRPVLALLAFEAAGGGDPNEVMDLALSAELIHPATLVHDDIYDQSKTRRGKPTLHASHGMAHGIIAGDYLFVLGFELGGRYEARIVERILTRYIVLSGVWHVASEPISKFDLLKLFQEKLGWEGVIKPNDEFVCDRSLNADRFNQATGYTPPSWEAMIGELAQQP